MWSAGRVFKLTRLGQQCQAPHTCEVLGTPSCEFFQHFGRFDYYRVYSNNNSWARWPSPAPSTPPLPLGSGALLTLHYLLAGVAFACLFGTGVYCAPKTLTWGDCCAAYAWARSLVLIMPMSQRLARSNWFTDTLEHLWWLGS